MVRITITSNIPKGRKSWVQAVSRFTVASTNFLTKEQPRIQKHVHEIVQATVYDVYDPVEYERTYNLLRSMRAYIKDKGNPFELMIDCNVPLVRAKNASGGYPQFVAGEGPGIGFLKPFYGSGASLSPSYFPRRFHDHIVMTGSSVYNNLEADLNGRMLKLVNRYF